MNPTQGDGRMTQMRFDAKERLIAWCARQDEYYLLCRVTGFREVLDADGNKIDVPTAIICQFSSEEADPLSVPERGKAIDLDEKFVTPSQYDDTKLQYNQARWCDPGVGRWISEDPRDNGSCEANWYPYPRPPQHPTDSSDDGRSTGNDSE